MPRIIFFRVWGETETSGDRDVPWVVRAAANWGITIAALLAARGFVNWLWGEDRIFIDDAGALLVAAAVFVVVRAVVRPLLIVLTCPFQVLTLGLFILVVNALVLLFAEAVCRALGVGFRIEGIVPAFVAAIVISVVSSVLSRLLRWGPLGSH